MEQVLKEFPATDTKYKATVLKGLKIIDFRIFLYCGLYVRQSTV